MIVIRNLQKRYGGRLVLDIPQHEFAAGGIRILAGHNGSGKTTLLRLINGLEKPDAGVIECAIDSREMVFCPQKPYMFTCSVQQNVEYGLRARGVADAAARARQMMEQLQIAHLARQAAVSLSAGEMQKTAIARALVLKPRLLLLDEPFANLDDDSRTLVEKCIIQHQNRGATVIIATHLLQQVYRLSVDVTKMARGRILAADPVNVFEGQLRHVGGQCLLDASGRLEIAVATSLKGLARGVLAPEDVVLSLQPVQSSMRNCFPGTVEDVKPEPEHVDVIVNIGIRLVARVTPESVAEMKLEPDKTVYAAFKATAVKVFPTG